MALKFTLPGAIDGLMAVALKSADPDTQVEDGQPIEDIQRDVIAIGLTDDNTEVATTHEFASMGSFDTREIYLVPCMVKTNSGDTDMKVQRDRAFQILRSFANILANNQNLDGAVSRAQIVDVVYDPARLPNLGVSVTLTFRVRIDAFSS